MVTVAVPRVALLSQPGVWQCPALPGQAGVVLQAPGATVDPRDKCHPLPMPSQGQSSL